MGCLLNCLEVMLITLEYMGRASGLSRYTFKLETVAFLIGMWNVVAAMLTLIMSSLLLFAREDNLLDVVKEALFAIATMGAAVTRVVEVQVLGWFIWIVSFVYTIFSFALLVGIFMKKTKIIRAFCIFYIIILLMGFLGHCITFWRAILADIRSSTVAFSCFNALVTDALLMMTLYVLNLTIHKFKKENSLPWDEFTSTNGPLDDNRSEKQALPYDLLTKIKVEKVALAVGIFYAMLSVLNFVSSSKVIFESETTVPLKFYLVSLNGVMNGDNDYFLTSMTWFIWITSFFAVMFSIVLIVGLIKKSPKVINVFYCFYIVMACFYYISFLVLLCAVSSKTLFSTSDLKPLIECIICSYMIVYVQIAMPLYIIRLTMNKYMRQDDLPMDDFTSSDPPGYHTLSLHREHSDTAAFV